MNKKNKMKLPKRYYVGFVLCIFITIINVGVWFTPKSVDWYRIHVFPLWTNTLARFMSVFPFSVGEILIYTGIFSLIFGLILCIFSFIKKDKYKKIRAVYKECLIWILLWVYMTETLNCFVMYHATTLEETYYQKETYSNQQLITTYNSIVKKVNQLSMQMKRDKKGHVVYPRKKMYAQCKIAMQNISNTYPYLKGYYPNPKRILSSDMMSQQYLEGIYFPFTLESNYNQTMYIMNDPATICHEFSHLKGVIFEDEANYFGFVACINSNDKFMQYGGYLSVLDYMADDIYKNCTKKERQSVEKINAYVRKDLVFLTKDSWDKVEKKAIVSTKTAKAVTNQFLESNLKMNGVLDGVVSYSKVVKLVLDYYNEKDQGKK